MTEPDSLFIQAKKVIPSGVNSPVRHYLPSPLFIKKANGSHIWDSEGKQLIDFCNGYGALLLGHRRREIISAVSRQLKMGTLYCAPTEQETTLSRMIVDMFPAMHKVRLVNTGGEATMTAIRLARGYTNKTKIVKFEGCYHGAHDSVLVQAGSGSAHLGIPVSKGIPPDISKNTLIARYNNFEDIENILARGNVAGVIIEPVPANMGLVLPSKNFLTHVRKVTQKHDVPLIFDEVVTGFRVSPGGAQRHLRIKPDITTLAKALGNGFAIAAVGGKKQIMDQLAPAGRVYQASTFAGNPISTSAAMATLKTIRRLRHSLYPKLERHCKYVAKGISDLATDLHISHHVNSFSSMMQIFFSKAPVTDYATAMNADTKKFNQMFRLLLQNGIFIAPSQFEVMFFSNAHTKDDLGKTLDAYEIALRGTRD